MSYWILGLLSFGLMSCQQKAVHKEIPVNETLTAEEAEDLLALLYQKHQTELSKQKSKAWDSRVLNYKEYEMPFFYKKWGETPENGYPLYISLHGGGAGSASMNDEQYSNQQHLYDETMSFMKGIYLAPRAPTNTWDLWHQDHIDILLNDLIQLAHLKEKINLNRVYLLGYSAGGDGVYQLAPRMADRFAAASMMAGHPNNASPLSLRNLPFSIQVGALDNAYNRNKVAQEWGAQLRELQHNDPKAYLHYLKLHRNKKHWMGLKDAAALPWMRTFIRNPIPQKVGWKQGKHLYEQFYWLGVPARLANSESITIVTYYPEENSINIESNDLKLFYIYLNDKMLDLDKEVVVRYKQTNIFKGKVSRKAVHIKSTLARKGDPDLSFCSRLTITENKKVVGD
ncbi:MAG: hypothetical protein MK212_20345 [Saprospiraceae bacterium]|nr:hypothetical protein [Saprospiraceae bacterium]